MKLDGLLPVAAGWFELESETGVGTIGVGLTLLSPSESIRKEGHKCPD